MVELVSSPASKVRKVVVVASSYRRTLSECLVKCHSEPCLRPGLDFPMAWLLFLKLWLQFMLSWVVVVKEAAVKCRVCQECRVCRSRWWDFNKACVDEIADLNSLLSLAVAVWV